MYQSSYQSFYCQAPFFSSEHSVQNFFQNFFPFHSNQNSSSNNFQQWSTDTILISLQVSTDLNNQCQPLQSTTENANQNSHHEPYQNWAESLLNNQWNKGKYRPNYSQSNYPQQLRVYYGETEGNQFKDYKNDYYDNSHFEQKDDWVNYIIDEDQALSKAYKKAQQFNDNVNINHTIVQMFYYCFQCSEFFSSNNTLHKHIWISHYFIKGKKESVSEIESKSVYFIALNLPMLILSEKLVWLNITQVFTKGYRFWEWQYVTVQVRLSQNSQTVSICLNISCTVSLIDWGFLKEHASDVSVRKMTSLMKVWGLEFSSHAAKDYVELNLYFSDNHSRTAVIHWEIYVINNLKAHILVETDILISEQVNILLSQREAVIESCKNIELDLNVITLLNQTN